MPFLRLHPQTWLPAAASAVLLVLLATACLAQQPEPSLEERAQDIDKSLMCPVCPSETIDQSQAQLAKDMRSLVREMLAEGKSKQDILDFFVSRYGADVLAAPPKSGFNVLIWGSPILALLAAGTALALVLRAARKGKEAAAAAPAEAASLSEQPAPQGLEPYLARVDQEMEKALGPRRPGQSRPGH